MAENKRYLIALGLMETDPEKIKDKDSFKYWSKVRQAVADKVEGAILAYCMQSGIYRRFSNPQVDVPDRLLVDQLRPEGKEKGLYVPWEFDGTPEEFVQTAVEYEQLCRQLENPQSFLDIFSRTRNRFEQQRINGPGVPLRINGVVASSEQIDQLDSTVSTLFDHLKYKSFENFGSTDLPVERCVVAKAQY